jgi:hypothetical protein
VSHYQAGSYNVLKIICFPNRIANRLVKAMMPRQGGRVMDQRSIEKHFRRWHRRDKPTTDPIGGEPASQDRRRNPMTESGLSVADQLRKEWDPRMGGLPVFLGLKF